MDNQESDFIKETFPICMDKLRTDLINSAIKKDNTIVIGLISRLLSFVGNCDDLHDPKNIAIAKDFVKECENFENTSVSLRPLFSFYGDMSKAYLHATDFKKADSYAVASYKLCQLENNIYGLKSSLINIMDNQIVKCENELAYYFCKEYLKIPTSDKEYLDIKYWIEEALLKQNIVINEKSIEKKAIRFLEKVKLPKLYCILIDDKKSNVESGIRLTMAQLNVSRGTALKYQN